MEIHNSVRHWAGALLVAALLLLVSSEVLAQGVLREVLGPVTVFSGKDKPVPAVINATVMPGQTVTTGPKGTAILRFPDATVVALEQNSSFTLREYAFDEQQPSAMAALFGLAQGAMRTLTGRINQGNREAVRVVTPAATVGIRGSDVLTAHVVATSTTTQGVIQGAVNVNTATGVVSVGPGQAAVTAALGPTQLVPLQSVMSAFGTLPSLQLGAIAGSAAAGAQAAATGGLGAAAGAAAAAAAAAIAVSAGQDNPGSGTTGTTGTTGTQ
jgi:hypothetical protein